tara:strand:+ start:461 stop:922 length:462 start_codon:yes stop_codon:yes gene_type:complete
MWEETTKKANYYFSKGQKYKAASIYEKLYTKIENKIFNALNDQTSIDDKILIQLIVTNDNFIEALDPINEKVQQIKLQAKTLKTLMKTINSEPLIKNIVINLYNKSYFNYCLITENINSKFSRKISEEIFSDKLSFDKFHYHLKFNQSKTRMD